jgi:hypothetical protein
LSRRLANNWRRFARDRRIYQSCQNIVYHLCLYFKKGLIYNLNDAVWYKRGCTRLTAASDKVYQLLAHGRWFSPGTPASSTSQTGPHDIAESGVKLQKFMCPNCSFKTWMKKINALINKYPAKLLVFWEKIIHAQLLNVADDGFSYL